MTGWQGNGGPAPANPPSGGSSGKPATQLNEFSIAKLSLCAGDILVVKVHQPIPSETAYRIRQHVAQEAPGHRVLVIDHNLDLSVLTKAEVDNLSTK